MKLFLIWNLFSRFVWFQVACYTTYTQYLFDKNTNDFFFSNAFKNILLKDHLLRSYDY